MKTRYWKVIRDLQSDSIKYFMLVLAVALGVWGIGTILGSYNVIKREMAVNYLGTQPASATIELEDSISTGLLDSVRQLPGIKVAERHATVVARMRVEDRWYPLLLFVVDDFAGKRTNVFRPVSGAAVPAVQSMLVERSAYSVMHAREGDSLLVKTPHGVPYRMKLSGTVHDAGLAPAWQEQAGYGYTTLASLQKLGETQGFNQLRIIVAESNATKQSITDRAKMVTDWLRSNGHAVHEIQVPSPGKHPHQGQMNAVMTLFVIFCFMVLILGSILVATSLSTLMVKQVRQIGIMKTIGATPFQVFRIYLLLVLIICMVALVLAIPLSKLAADAFSDQLAGLLNLEIHDDTIPFTVPLIQVAAGIVIPCIAAAFPIVRGSRIKVRTALDNYGVSQQTTVYSPFFLRLSRLRRMNETLLLAVRNVFRQRARLNMTLGLLAVGGAMFMSALNVSEAWDQNLQQIHVQRLYDMEIRLNNVVKRDSIVGSVAAIPGVRKVEGWRYCATSIAKMSSSYQVTNTYPDKGHGSFSLQALPVPTQLLHPSVVGGQWLHNPQAREVVLNQGARGLLPAVQTGDVVSLLIDGKPTEWTVIGFTRDVGSPAIAYVSLDAFNNLLNMPGSINMLRIGYNDRSREQVLQKNRVVEQVLESGQFSVSLSMPVWMLRNAIAGHMKVLVNSLLSLAVLMGLVGMLGLLSTMSMNVLERTREIGVMRAIGATPRKIYQLITWEGLLTGIASLIIAFALSLVLSFFLGRFIGNLSFRTPLSLTLSLKGIGIWMLIIIVGSYAASFYPARRANRITTREALGYE